MTQNTANHGAHQLREDEIAVAAYFNWEMEGRPTGKNAQHWDTAIQQLLVAEISGLHSKLAKKAAPSVSRITYPLPSATVYKKFYNKHDLFSSVDWTNWKSAIDGFESRFVEWYFEPLSKLGSGDDAYPVLCAVCALIDVFTYYDGDREWHCKTQYKTFLLRLDRVFKTPLTSPITITRFRSGSWTKVELRKFFDVFYAGVRCSLLHHGDLASFAGMNASGVLAMELPSAGMSVCGNHSFSVVVFDPWKLLDRLRSWFKTYCDDLRANPKSHRAQKFRQRFAVDFGISVS